MPLYLHQNPIKKTLAAVSLGVGLAVTGLSLPLTIQAKPVPALAVPDFTEVVAGAEGSVVNIRTTEAVRVRSGASRGSDPYDLFRWFFGPDFAPPGAAPGPDRRQGPSIEERTVPRGVGSGFIISDDGYILTNNHVVTKSNGIFVTLTTGKEYKAKIVGVDPRTDIALIKIDASDLKPLPIGDSSSLKKGQWVLAIGSPFGLESTVTSGIVSAINRDTGEYLPFIQTDVAVNPGNSGGPLINLAGEVVGVNSQIISQSGGFMGISLAIPIDEAMRVVQQLKSHGKVTRGRIGVQIGSVSDDVAEALGMEETHGALVSNVEEGAPAAQAGIRAGDVIISFNGTRIKHMADLPRLVGNTQPGSRADIEVWRKGKVVKLKVSVAEIPASEDEQLAEGSDDSQSAPVDVLGLSVKEVPADLKKSLNIKSGVMVVDTENPALAAGLTQGDIILMVNDQDVTSVSQYAQLIKQLDKSKAVAVLVMREKQSQWITLRPRK